MRLDLQILCAQYQVLCEVVLQNLGPLDSTSRLPSVWHSALVVLFWLQILAFFTSISLMDLFSTLSALVVLSILVKFPQERKLFLSLVPTGLRWLLFAYVGVIWLGLFLSPSTWQQILAPALEPKWILLMWVFAYQWSLRPNSRFLYVTLAFGVALTASLCVSQSLLHFDPTRAGFLPLDPIGDSYRASGFFSYAMTFAHTFNLLLFLFLGVSLVGQPLQIKNVFLAAMGIFALFLSHTRGVWFGLPIGLLVIGLALQIRPRLKFLAAAVVVLMGVTVFFVHQPLQERLMSIIDFNHSSHSERFTLWRVNLSLFQERPLLGWGYLQNYYQLDRKFAELGIPENHFKGHAHNQWIQYLATLGVLGTAVFAAIIGWFLLQTISLMRKNPNIPHLDWGIAAGGLAAQLSWLIGGLTQVNFEDSKVRFILIFIWAALLAMKVQTAKDSYERL